jgi:hypothetical protein
VLPLTASILGYFAGGLFLLVCWLLPPGVCMLKGKSIFAVFGLFFVSAVGLIGAIRLAKPDSYWACRFYDDAKCAKARTRFPAE